MAVICDRPDTGADAPKHGILGLVEVSTCYLLQRGLDKMELLSAAEVSVAFNISRETIRQEQFKGRWPEPDGRVGRANVWKPETIARAIANREESIHG